MLLRCLSRLRLSRSFASWRPRLDPLVADIIASSNDLKQIAPLSTQPATINPASETSKVLLPPLDQWRKRFPPLISVMNRVSVRNPQTARAMADAFVPDGSRDKVIVEAYPGPGQLTRALLDLPKERIKKLIVLEENENYLEYLQPLEALDPRVKILPVGGYNWNSYLMIDEMQLLKDVATMAWEDGVHPNLHFISHLPSSIEGEQLIAQFFRCIPDQQWLFKYGRTPMSFILGDHLWKRISAPLSASERCKLTVIAEATAECDHAVLPEALLPYELHFHPARPSMSTSPEGRKHNSRRIGNPFQAINIVPREEQAIKKGQLDEWDFCLRRLFVQRATALRKALPSLAPGAQTLVKKVTDPNLPMLEQISPSKNVGSLTVHEWKIIIKAFHEWPFAPQDLSITDTFTAKDSRI